MKKLYMVTTQSSENTILWFAKDRTTHIIDYEKYILDFKNLSLTDFENIKLKKTLDSYFTFKEAHDIKRFFLYKKCWAEIESFSTPFIYNLLPSFSKICPIELEAEKVNKQQSIHWGLLLDIVGYVHTPSQMMIRKIENLQNILFEVGNDLNLARKEYEDFMANSNEKS